VTPDKTAPSAMVLVSAAFIAGESIPARYSLYGENLTPDLTLDKVPEDTKGFALICRDPDAPSGTFYHWVLFNIPENVRGLPEGLGRDVSLPTGGTQGTNSFQRVGYDGPKPPRGTHRYYFDLYALDAELALDQTATAGRLQEAMKGHVLAQASLMGKYKK
jgi:Raf kinase inhibitor-like YbhB/YbcL family protein